MSEMVQVAREELGELRLKAAKFEHARYGTAMHELNAAYRVGWIAGFGLGAAKQVEDSGMGTPMCDVHTSWTNYVPAWVDEAMLGEHWKQGFESGKAAAAGRQYVVVTPPK